MDKIVFFGRNERCTPRCSRGAALSFGRRAWRVSRGAGAPRASD